MSAMFLCIYAFEEMLVGLPRGPDVRVAHPFDERLGELLQLPRLAAAATFALQFVARGAARRADANLARRKYAVTKSVARLVAARASYLERGTVEFT